MSHEAESDLGTDPTAHWSFETKQIHVGQTPDGTTNARALPIYQTTSFTFDDTAHAAALFGLEVEGGVTPGLVRLAVGIEGIDDILADLDRGFDATKPFTEAVA